MNGFKCKLMECSTKREKWRNQVKTTNHLVNDLNSLDKGNQASGLEMVKHFFFFFYWRKLVFLE